jgi:hypothetical protein
MAKNEIDFRELITVSQVENLPDIFFRDYDLVIEIKDGNIFYKVCPKTNVLPNITVEELLLLSKERVSKKVEKVFNGIRLDEEKPERKQRPEIGDWLDSLKPKDMMELELLGFIKDCWRSQNMPAWLKHRFAETDVTSIENVLSIMFPVRPEKWLKFSSEEELHLWEGKIPGSVRETNDWSLRTTKGEIYVIPPYLPEPIWDSKKAGQWGKRLRTMDVEFANGICKIAKWIQVQKTYDPFVEPVKHEDKVLDDGVFFQEKANMKARKKVEQEHDDFVTVRNKRKEKNLERLRWEIIKQLPKAESKEKLEVVSEINAITDVKDLLEIKKDQEGFLRKRKLLQRKKKPKKIKFEPDERDQENFDAFSKAVESFAARLEKARMVCWDSVKRIPLIGRFLTECQVGLRPIRKVFMNHIMMLVTKFKDYRLKLMKILRETDWDRAWHELIPMIF